VIHDRSGRLASIATQSVVWLELGCGARRHFPEAIGIDRRDLPGVDVVGDVYEVLEQIPEASVDRVYSHHFLEHVSDVERLVLELKRIMKAGGTMTAVVPHFSNPYFYSDYTHRTAFGLYSFSYLAEDALFHRRVPRYNAETGFILVVARLNFKAGPPFYFRHVLARAFGALVNSTRFMKEFYEGALSGVVPCFEIEFVLQRCEGARAHIPAV